MVLFELTTITFEEFINYKTNDRYKDNLSAFAEIEKNKVLQLLTEYMNFGGYPRVILETEQNEKLLIIDEIYRSVLEKDVAYLLKVVKTEAFSSLIRILSSQIGTICRFFFAHIWCKKYDRPLTNSEMSDAAHKLTDQEVSLGLFEADA